MLLKPVAAYGRIIFVHGVSRDPINVEKLGRATALALGVPAEKVKVYEYEHLLDESKVTRGANLAAKLGAMVVAARTGINPEAFLRGVTDRASDVWLIGNPLFKRTREQVVDGLRRLIAEQGDPAFGDTLLVGHSNGSVVTRLAIEGLPSVPDLLTIGSPLHMKVFEKCLGVKPDQEFPRWVNLYSKWRDPVGYAKIPARLGCLEKNQFLVHSSHDSEPYLKKFVELQGFK